MTCVQQAASSKEPAQTGLSALRQQRSIGGVDQALLSYWAANESDSHMGERTTHGQLLRSTLRRHVRRLASSFYGVQGQGGRQSTLFEYRLSGRSSTTGAKKRQMSLDSPQKRIETLRPSPLYRCHFLEAGLAGSLGATPVPTAEYPSMPRPSRHAPP